MNPFDAPPHGDPLSVDPPGNGSTGRGKMALVAVLTAGLIGGGIVGVSALASADRPSSVAATPDTPDEPTDEQSDDDTEAPAPEDDEPTNDNRDTDAPDAPARPPIDGEIVIDDGDGEPVVIDLGDLDIGVFEQLEECLGVPRDADFDFGEFGDNPFEDFDVGQLLGDLPFDPEDFPFDPEDFGDFGSFEILDGVDGSVTIAGPDGVSVVDLGENGSVTITKSGGEITVDTTGDAEVTELDDLFGDFTFDLDADWDELDGELQQKVDEFLEGLPQLDELEALPALDLPGADEIQRCVDEALGN